MQRLRPCGKVFPDGPQRGARAFRGFLGRLHDDGERHLVENDGELRCIPCRDVPGGQCVDQSPLGQFTFATDVCTHDGLVEVLLSGPRTGHEFDAEQCEQRNQLVDAELVELARFELVDGEARQPGELGQSGLCEGEFRSPFRHGLTDLIELHAGPQARIQQRMNIRAILHRRTRYRVRAICHTV
ncbi:hypothetical protein P350_24680 [Burkholderia cepacia JBK9]|nr:hypothetical protein P350_24680 [Burkholderia cepacia JBK9]